MVKSGWKWYIRLWSWAAVTNKEAPVGFETDTPKKSPDEIQTTDISTAFTSLAFLVAAVKQSRAPLKGKAHVSRQSPNPRGRKRTPQSPGGIQARDRREIWHAILHHELRRKECSSLSLRGVGTDRAEAGGALHLQSYEEKVSRPGQLLRTDGRDGRSGAAADPATGKGQRADQGRSGGAGQSDLPNS